MKKEDIVVIESPYAGNVERNIADDLIPEERSLGIEAGLLVGELAAKSVVYTDFGFSSGMKYGIQRAEAAGRPVEYRSLPDFSWSEHHGV